MREPIFGQCMTRSNVISVICKHHRQLHIFLNVKFWLIIVRIYSTIKLFKLKTSLVAISQGRREQHNCTKFNTIKHIFCHCRNCEMMHCASETRKRSVMSSSNALKFTRLTVSKASKLIIQNPTTSAASGYLTRYLFFFAALWYQRTTLNHCVNLRVSSVTGVWLKMDVF